MRKIIAALQTSVDGFIEGPNGELDWAMAEDEETWRDVDEMLRSVDTFILGRGIIPPTKNIGLPSWPNRRTRMKTLMRAVPIRYPISSFPRPWTSWHGRRHGSLGTRRNPKNEATAWQGHADLWWRHSGIQSDESGLD